mgnify:CR=1 FL=1
MKFQKGDLVMSTKGNLGIILCTNQRWCDVMWCSTGYIRQGFGCVQLRKIADIENPVQTARQLKKTWGEKEVLNESR